MFGNPVYGNNQPKPDEICGDWTPKRESPPPEGADIPEDEFVITPDSPIPGMGPFLPRGDQIEKSCGTCKKYPADFNDDGCEDCGDQEPYDNWEARDEKKCENCHGKGVTFVSPPGTSETCWACDGTGKVKSDVK
jgi:hypothetical protein